MRVPPPFPWVHARGFPWVHECGVRSPLRPGQVSTLLPRTVRAALQAASQVDPGVPFGESEARIAAVRTEILLAKTQYPECFVREVIDDLAA